jgi:hypothetical protein
MRPDTNENGQVSPSTIVRLLELRYRCRLVKLINRLIQSEAAKVPPFASILQQGGKSVNTHGSSAVWAREDR